MTIEVYLMDWLANNKEWIFSGIGVAIIVEVLRRLLRRIANSKHTQHQKASAGMTAIQATGDIHFNAPLSFGNKSINVKDKATNETRNVPSSKEIAEIDPKLLDRDVGTSFLQQKLPSILRKAYTNSQLKTVTIAMIDIDNQTGINKKFGIEVGDEVIRTVLWIIKEQTASKFVGRWGADSLYVVLLDWTFQRATHLMQSVSPVINTYNWATIATGLRVTCNVGVAEKRNMSEDTADWICRACEGLLTAKADSSHQVRAGPLFLPKDFNHNIEYYDS